ncbi:MAG: ABC transporter substrate-binding protein [Planctomycetaceae bacterium]|jgi:iron complex transport system substrate-binding protein|nr:ABC transporter substrate-binding protein [Planctomycetaceae bacterium]
MKKIRIFLFILFVNLFFGCIRQDSTVVLLEPIRTLEQLKFYREAGLVPEKIDRIFCSGGTLRLAVYLECAEKVVAVDSNERREKGRSGMKGYLAAHPEFYDMPVGGETSGRDNPETLLGLKNRPQLIIKADTGAGYDPVELTRRTGIPVLLVPMRGITVGRKDFDAGLRLMGAALGKSERSEAVLEFFDREMADIKLRTQKDEVSKHSKPLVYVGGVSYNGSHAFHSTEAGYPPFVIADAHTPIKENENELTLGKRHTMLAKEKILEWNPDILFLDLGTLYLGAVSGLVELQTDPAYCSLKAVKEGNIYSLLPNTFYFVNHDAVLINAWFVGKTLYPEQFTDIDPKKKADEIFTFLVGKPVFEQLNAELDHLALKKLNLSK